MSATISILPIWKKNSTPAEWLAEMASIALAYPERFTRMVIVYEEVDATNFSVRTRSHVYNIDNNTLKMGTLATAQAEVFDDMKRRN